MLNHEYPYRIVNHEFLREVSSNQSVTKPKPYATPVCFSEEAKLKISFLVFSSDNFTVVLTAIFFAIDDRQKMHST